MKGPANPLPPIKKTVWLSRIGAVDMWTGHRDGGGTSRHSADLADHLAQVIVGIPVQHLHRVAGHLAQQVAGRVIVQRGLRRLPHRPPLLWRNTTTPSPCRQQAKPDWLKHEIIRLKALMPNAGCRTIATIFNRRHACHLDTARRATVGKSYVADLVRQHHYEIKVMRRHIKHRVPVPMARNRVWALDLTAKTDAAKHTHIILGLIDHGSRALMALQALPNKTSWTLLGHVCLAIGRHGKPLAIRTDNEPVFKSRVFRSALACMGIRQQFTDPGCPWQNGRIERLFLTLKHKLDQIEVPGLHALNKALGQFSFFYNFVRPHQHLQGRTPAEAWAGVDPWAAPVKREEWFQAWDGLLCGFHLRR